MGMIISGGQKGVKGQGNEVQSWEGLKLSYSILHSVTSPGVWHAFITTIQQLYTIKKCLSTTLILFPWGVTSVLQLFQQFTQISVIHVQI